MAGVGLLALLDDIATLLDDVSVLTKVAVKKTAGVLGDDLALNAEQVSGVRAERELPVVWAVAKGSVKNKLILVPAALLLSVFLPWLITPFLMLGGAYLCFEGFEKVAHKFLHHDVNDEAEHRQKLEAMADEKIDLVSFEKEKIKGAIRTDFILSAEIIVIALGVVQDAAFSKQVVVVSVIAAFMTIFVYGLVAAIVKLDDVGMHFLDEKKSDFMQAFGRALLRFCPFLMKTLSVLGTAAMFLVGGGILIHGIPGSHDILHHVEALVHSLPGVGSVLSVLSATLINGFAGVIAGAILVGVFELFQKARKAF